MIMHRGLKVLALVVSILGAAGWAFARIDNMPESPAPEGSSGLGISILYSVVFLAAICVIGFKSSRRTQID
jgi:hypothetical protein